MLPLVEQARESFNRLLTRELVKCMIAFAVFSLSVISRFSTVVKVSYERCVGRYSWL